MPREITVEGIVELNDLMDKLAQGEKIQAKDFETEERVATWSDEELFDFGKYIN